MQKHFPGKKVEEYRRMLGLFGVSGDLALQQVNTYYRVSNLKVLLLFHI